MAENEQEMIAALSKQLQDMQEHFQSFIYTISHDLSAPIRTIVAFGELLEANAGDKLDEKAKHYLSFMIHGGEKAAAMMTGLLEYSRLDSRPRKLSKVNTHTLVELVLSNLEQAIKESGAHIDIGKLPTIIADEENLSTLFTALIDNGIKYHKPGEAPHLRIRAESAGTGWQFSVTDNGIGFDERYSKEIFNIFRRLHRENEFSGIGMGLPIAKKIIQRHEGIIEVSSEAGNGATFYFTIPELALPKYEDNLSLSHTT